MKSRKWNNAIRVLTLLPIPFVLLILYFLFFGGKAGVDLSGDDFEVELRELPESDTAAVDAENETEVGSYTDVVEKNVFASSRERPTVRYTPGGSSRTGSTSSGEHVLLGVVVAGSGQGSMAIIRTGGKGGETESYTVGDDIDNMVVDEILYDRVILRNGEKETILELVPREDEKSASPAKVSPAQKNRPRENMRKSKPRQ